MHEQVLLSRRLLLQSAGDWMAFRHIIEAYSEKKDVNEYRHKDQQLVLDYNLKFRIWDIDDSAVKDWDEQTALRVSHNHKTVTEHYRYGYAAFDFSSVTINKEDHQKNDDDVFVGVFNSSNDCSCIITMHMSICMKMAQV